MPQLEPSSNWKIPLFNNYKTNTIIANIQSNIITKYNYVIYKAGSFPESVFTI